MFFDIREYALVMAQYNQWMNMNIFRAAALLDDADFTEAEEEHHDAEVVSLDSFRKH